ncbi:MAG: TraR/DksA C4-type zinc finger protein [Myxococcota bacterium]|nr:TraR/DksA C4-type zinc finger protein [Myxococcota bacterium]
MATSRRAGKKTAKKKTAKKTAAKRVAKKAAPKKAAKKAAPKKSTSKKAAPKKAAKKSTSKKTPKKAASKKAPAKKKTPAKKAASKKAASKKAPAKKSTSKTAPAKKSASKKAPAKKAKSASKPVSKPTPTKPAKKKTPAAPKVDKVEMDAATRRLAEMKVAAHPDAGLTAKQITHLHGKLVTERARKVSELERHMQEALGETSVMPDETDMAQRSTEQAYLIRFADKERKLLNEIDRALEKLRVGEYGVCEGTEEPIGFKRLELRPWTRYSVGYKEQIERERSQHRR